jgi:serine/threonine protein kinase
VGFLDSLKSLFGGGSREVNVAKHFDLRGKTGQGSMSKVYQAYDRDLGRTICLKLLDKVKTAAFEAKFKKRGLKKPSEGKICTALKHPRVVTTFEHGVTTKGEPYLVMEWVEGAGLNYLIETKSAKLNGNRINIMLQLCDAIQYLHDQKFLHRDLCPRNIMVTKDGDVKLIDFGLTIPYEPAFCHSGNRTGTVDYIPPEVIKGAKTDHRVVVFALGVTAYEVITGSLPWERSPSSEETIRRHLNTPARNPKDVMPNLDDELCKVLLKCVDRDANVRYPSARAFKEALENVSKQDY